MSLDGTPENTEENGVFPKVGAFGAAVEMPEGLFDPDLAAVVARWASLPAAIRVGILAMVRTAGG